MENNLKYSLLFLFFFLLLNISYEAINTNNGNKLLSVLLLCISHIGYVYSIKNMEFK